MFKLESYITPILLSYVDKYIKNFRPEDSQVSLWGGEVSFHNLDLRLEVLEEELQSPFSFVSGHIHELLILVPWTKLASEPITVTINTIECILKLKGCHNNSDCASSSSSGGSSGHRDKRRNAVKKEEIENPPGYIQSVVNKIVGNITINCNNLILKYVEEDIVVSMNIKLLTVESADEEWKPAFTDQSTPQVLVRKLITVHDLTVCLDRRNAAGKIDVYQEPMLYRCSLELRFLRKYHTATIKQASTTRIDVHCTSMEFSMTSQQFPMLMRLIVLVQTLRQLKKERLGMSPSDSFSAEDVNSDDNQEMGWAGWAWSFVPAILPTWDDDWAGDPQTVVAGHTMHLGVYVDNALFSFKVSESSNEKTYYAPRKLKYWPILSLKLQGCMFQMVTHNINWVNVQAGVAKLSLLPSGDCVCGADEVADNTQPQEYFKSLMNPSICHFSDSLLDSDSFENKGVKRTYNLSWDNHIAQVNEEHLLNRSPAFAVDFLYNLDFPDDFPAENIPENTCDLEYSNFKERSLTRVFIGSFNLRYSAGLIHRINVLQQASELYDYQPYFEAKPTPSLSELPPPSSEDYDSLMEYIQTQTTQIHCGKSSVEFILWDHFPNQTKKRHQSFSSLNEPHSSNKELPKLRFEIESFDVKLEIPMYPNRLVYTTCKLPNPPKSLLESCYSKTSVHCSGLKLNLIVKDLSSIVLNPTQFTFTANKILLKKYWQDKDICLEDLSASIEAINVTSTKARLLIACHIVDSIINRNKAGLTAIYDSTLLIDSYMDARMEHLEFILEHIFAAKSTTICTQSYHFTLDSCRAFVIEPMLIQKDKEATYTYQSSESSNILLKTMSKSVKIRMTETFNMNQSQQVIILSGPEVEMKGSQMVHNSNILLSVTVQIPNKIGVPDHPALVLFNLSEFRVSLDPLLCRWLQYKPKKYMTRKDKIMEAGSVRRRRCSEASGTSLETPRRIGPQPTSVHSSENQPRAQSLPIRSLSPPPEFTQETHETQWYKNLLEWHIVWKSLLVIGDIDHVTIYFPTDPVPALGAQNLQGAYLNNQDLNHDLEIFVLKLPGCSLRSANQRQKLDPYVLYYPIKLPDNIWNDGKKSFPWSISIWDFTSYTVRKNKKHVFIKPVTCNATIAVTTKTYRRSSSDSVNHEVPKRDSKTGSTSDLHADTKNQSSPKSDHNITPGKVPSLVEMFNRNSSANVEQNAGTSSDQACSMAVCVYIDTMPIVICMSEPQVALISSIASGLLEISSNLVNDVSGLKQPIFPRSPNPTTPTEILFKESTRGSTVSGTSHSVEETESECNPKFTIFVQWTLTRFSVILYGNEGPTQLKLLLDIEDIVNSFDMQNVYVKFKSKIATAGVRHFKRDTYTKRWVSGPYLGIVMKVRENGNTSSEDNCFASVVFTRARCGNVHSRWGASKKNKYREKSGKPTISRVRYLSELMVTLQSVDIVLSPKTLSSFLMVLQPLTVKAEQEKTCIPCGEIRSDDPGNFQSLAVLNLPLIYLDVRGLRVILPSSDSTMRLMHQDVYILQIAHINLNPTPDNPICRVPLRPDLYQQAAQAGLLNIPGSEMEDRQYQLTASAFNISTCVWSQLKHCLSAENTEFNLRTMNENPALEWNNMDSKKSALSPNLVLIPVVNKFDLCLVAAPAMVHGPTIICGHAVEINCVSDLDVNISIDQVKLAQALAYECSHMMNASNDEDLKRSSVVYPYAKTSSNILPTEDSLLVNEIQFETNVVTTSPLDSGVDVGDFSSENITLSKINNISETIDEYALFTKKLTEKPIRPFYDAETFIPFELLFTGGTISIAFYQNHRTTKSHESFGSTTGNVMIMYEKGYEGSEDDYHEDNSTGQLVTQPLIRLVIEQPNSLVSKTAFDNRFQISIFDMRLDISVLNASVDKSTPQPNDYRLILIETKQGQLDPATGIAPALATVRWTSGFGKTDDLDITLARPIKVHFSMDRWLHLNLIYKKLLYCCQNDDVYTKRNIAQQTNEMPLPYCNPVSIYTKFNDIKAKSHGLGHLNLSTTQIMLNIKSRENDELNLSISGLKSKSVICNRPEKVQSTLNIEGLSLNLLNQNSTLIMLDPWSFEIYVNLFWESWQNTEENCLMQLNTDSDCFVLGVGPDHIKVLQTMAKEYEEIFEEISSESRYTVVQADDELCLVEACFSESSDNTKTTQGPQQTQDQHYKDDLRAGAFQFVDASVGEEIPLPYQVLFWSGIQGTGSMSWRYPQPRLLTKVHIYPVPFQINPDDSSNVTVYCQLQYYSEVHGTFLPYNQFTLSESKMLRLHMPTHIPDATAASVWRVLMSSTNFESDQNSRKRSRTDYSNQNMDFGLLVSPRALAACMRIDSFFSSTLVPRVKAVLKFSSIQLNLYNHLDLTKGFMMPQVLKEYQISNINPINQETAMLNLDSTECCYCRWSNDSQLISVDTSIKCSVLDYGFLTSQTLLEPLVTRLVFSQANMMNMSIVTKPIVIKFGPSIAHTLAVTEQMWTNNFLTPQTKDTDNSSLDLAVPELVIMTRYVICNDTNFTLRFGQSATDENIILPPKTCNYYAWRSHKKKQLLRVGIIEHDQMWSEIFGIEKCGRHLVKFDLNPDVIVLVNIEMLSSTQKKITFCGQLTIYNMTTEVFDMKVYPVTMDKANLVELPTHTLLGRSKGPSLVVDSNQDLFMRLRFQGLDTYWSGDIPLKENSKNHQPWLVKVPLQEKGHFLCIWCKVLMQDESNACRRILTVLWPLYMIRSHLPVSTKVQIDTPALDVHLQTSVDGRGITKQLYCPGTIDHSHQLTFQIEMGLPASNPYVPLNYSLIDQKQFFEVDISDIDLITKLLDEQLVEKSQWPFLGEEFPLIDWIALDQPQTNVTVRYQPTGPSSCSLLLELLPWCIMLNTSGLHLSVNTDGQEMSQLPHHGVLTPPKLENTFTIQVFMDNIWHVSNPLQFSGIAKENGGFYMPKITGLIPQDGTIKTVIQCSRKISNISISSEMKHDIRIVRIGSSHVAYNATDQPLKLVSFALRLDANFIHKDLPVETEVLLQPSSQTKGMGVPVTEWCNLTHTDTDTSMGQLNSVDYGFFICMSACEQVGMSCPIRVDKHPIRKSTTVPCEGYSIPLLITTHEHRGQIYITVQYDVNPQLLIVNESYLKLFCAQATQESISGQEEPTPVMESREIFVYHAIPSSGCTYYTMPFVNSNFPEIQNGASVDHGLILAVANEGDLSWCQPISVTSKSVMCIPLPNFGDIKITITPFCYTTTVVIQTVSEIEISAREIRSRLSCSGSEILQSENKTIQKASPKISRSDQISVDNDDDISIATSATYSMSAASSNNQLPVYVKNSPLPRLVSAVIEHSRPTMRSYALPTIQESNTKLQPYIPPESAYSGSSLDMPSESNNTNNIRGSRFFNSITLGVFLKSLTVILMTDIDESGMDKTELCSFTFDEFAVTISPCPEEINIHMSMSNVQIDNQLFSRGDYDFPVVMMGPDREKSEDIDNFSLTTRIYELIAKSRHNSLISLRLDFEVFDNVHVNTIGIKDITLKTSSLSLYIEDGYFTVILKYFDKLSPANLILQPVQIKNSILKPSPNQVWVPEKILVTAKILGKPLKINRLTIYPVDLLLSVHSSIRLYIALDHSPLHFGTFEKKNILTTHFKLGHSLAMHYLSGAIFGAGWMVGSLEILGSPSGLARSVGSGLRDFVQKPYEGIMQGPWGFLVGIAQGSTSLMKHITAGTVNSLSKMAASVARNLDRLTLDSEHFHRTEELRRIRPQGLSQGLLHGLTGLGISILGAVGGIAHHPLAADSATGMISGVGLGLVGAIAKPISGAAELVALAGQGLLHGTGWHILPEARSTPIVQQSFGFNNANLKYIWKVLPSLLGGSNLLYVTEGTCITQSGGYEAVALVLTLQALIIFDLEEDACQREIALTELQGSPDIGDPTLICFRIIHPETPIPATSKMDIPPMDPTCRARVAQYIHYANTLNAPLHNMSDTQSETSLSSQLQTPTESDDSFGKHSKVIFYINPQTRNHFLNMFTLAKKQKEGLGFPVF